jgi:FixJ family two-component response regulator
VVFRQTHGTVGGRRPTAREVEIVRLIELGRSNKEIAAAVGIEVATVKNTCTISFESSRPDAGVKPRQNGAARDPAADQAGWLAGPVEVGDVVRI